jgi:hypothetical protein
MKWCHLGNLLGKIKKEDGFHEKDFLLFVQITMYLGIA